ncbi:MAG: cytochrome P450 [Acidimicrobiia bacterium]|nr:cytochrome P450 [Acidimicrobiia bacterium]
MRGRRRKPPGLPQGKLRTAAQLLQNPDMLAHLSAFDEQGTDLLGWRNGLLRFFASRSPDHVEHVFIGGHDKYRKATHYRLIAAVTGEGLLTAEGEEWASNRRTIQPIFAKRHLDALVPHMTGATADFLDRWHQRPDGDTLDVAAAMSEVTLDVVGRALFRATLSDAADRLRPAVVVGLRTGVAAARLQLLLALPRWIVDLGGWLLYNVPFVPPPLSGIRRSMHTIDDVVRGVVDARSSSGGEGDLLDLLLAARDEDGNALSRTQVRDEVVTIVLAGHETTANGLAWLWYLLAQNPEARERLQQEVDDVLGDRIPTAADADRLVWTTACFQEAMRLYPPAWVLEREAVAEDELDGYRIPKRSTVIFPVILIHRDPRWWPDPLRFDPTRFLGERAAQSHRGAYLPFGAGRRACVGATFALMEGTLIAAMLTQRFSLDLVDGAPVRPEATVTLRPRDGLPMTMHRRPALV